MFDFWSVACGLIALVWCAAVTRYVRNCRNRPVLENRIAEAPSGRWPSLTVIVPGRNERDCIESCVRSLLAQDYPGLSVVAVNDRSTDETGDILNRLRDEFPTQLRVLHVEELPAGWFGKPHALELAMEITRSELVCFTDADCRFVEPGMLRSAVAELHDRKLDLLTITPRFVMPTLWEQVTVPCCSEATLIWYCPNEVNSAGSRVAYANGAFILADRRELERIGGWRLVRQQVCEDLHLARWAKSRGLKLGVVGSSGQFETRSYSRVRDSWNGWSRIFHGGLTSRQLVLSLVRLSVLFLAPLAGLIVCTAMRLSGVEAGLSLAGIAALGVAVGLRAVCDVALFRATRSPMWLVPLAPLGRLFVMAATLRALLARLGWTQTVWRGAVFSAGRMVSQPQPVARPHTRTAPAGSAAGRREAAIRRS